MNILGITLSKKVECYFEKILQINQFIFNQNTVDIVIKYLMTNGLKDASGNTTKIIS